MIAWSVRVRELEREREREKEDDVGKVRGREGGNKRANRSTGRLPGRLFIPTCRVCAANARRCNPHLRRDINSLSLSLRYDRTVAPPAERATLLRVERKDVPELEMSRAKKLATFGAPGDSCAR